MQLRFGGPHIRSAFDQLRRNTQRQIGRQRQLVQLEMHRLQFGRRMAGQNRQLIEGLMQLLLQGRQSALQLRQRRLLRIDIHFGDRAQVELAVENRQGLAFGA